ncbi:MAG TPA: hypothetical protein VN817_02140 [Solirubrobacteraceae bacterium]|nr:hypothetical protein [Solirubrobacteraceae bacterium]
MSLTVILILNVVLVVALLALLALALAHPRKLTPHKPGITGNAWRIHRPLRHHAASHHAPREAREEHAARRLSPALD